MPIDRSKFIDAIKSKKIVDKTTAAIFVQNEGFKEEIIGKVDELETKVNQAVKDVKESEVVLDKVLTSVKGQKGDTGAKGDKGDKGDAGTNGIDGRNGIDGKDGKDGIDGISPTFDTQAIASEASKLAISEVLPQIPTIEELADTLPLMGESVRDSLELLQGEEKLDKSAIYGLNEELEKISKMKVSGGGGGSTARNFYQLYDVPQSYAGQAGKVLVANAAETALEFTTMSGGSGSATVLKTNGTANGSQEILNLVAGSNITLTDDLTGTVTITYSGSGGSGTVTGVELASANGFAGTVSSSTTTPVITLSTTITSPVLAGNGTAISAGTTTGTGSTVVLATSPTLVTPNIGTATATRIKIGTADGTAFVDVQGVTTVAQGMRMEGNTADALAFTSYVTGDGQLRFIFQNDGKLLWGSGSAVADTNLYRSAANVLKTDDTLSVVGNVNLPSLNASQLVSTDSFKNLQSLPIGAYPSLTEIGYVKGVTSTIQTQLSNLAVNSITFLLDGGGTGITSGIKGDLSIPYACTINSVTMLADQTGTLVVDIWKDTYANYPATVLDSITASAKATISATNKSVDTTLTGWTTSIAAGDTLRFNVDAAYTITRATLALKVTKV